MNVIICGSKKYANINFDKLVDRFDIIVRNNMLLPNNDYGTKNSNVQVLNCHINEYYEQKNYLGKKVTPEEWISIYIEMFDMSKEHIRSFLKYLELDSVDFQYFPENNTGLMSTVLSKHGINHPLGKQLRCGFSYMAECINAGIKPFLIGFSLDSEHALSKQYCNIEGKGICHDINSEINLIKKLHEAELVDATFCAIVDSKNLTLDSSLITPTKTSLNILRKVYK